MSVSREGSGESVHCAGSTEPSSFVSLIKLYQIFIQWPIKCCMKLCLHERDNISGMQIEYAIPMLVILAENATFHDVGFNRFNSNFRVGFEDRLKTARTLSKLYFGGDKFMRHYLYALIFKHYISA